LKYREKRVIVTGAAGFIGRRLVGRLRSYDARVQAWDRVRKLGIDESMDLNDAEAVRRAVGRFRPQLVFHLAAAGVSHARAHDPSVVCENVAILNNLMAALRENSGATRPTLVVAGTMAEYGPARVSIAETATCRPNTAYALSKYACTRLVELYSADSGIQAVVARLFHVYGPGETASRLLPTLVRQLSAGDAVPLSDGRQVRDFVHVDDVCECLAMLALTPAAAGQVVNVGTGVALAVREVAAKVAALLGAEASLLRFGVRDRSPGDADLLVANVTRLQALLSWTPPQRLLTARSIADVYASSARPDDELLGRSRTM